jgi:molybdenum cofactor cytidylyltransferase
MNLLQALRTEQNSVTSFVGAGGKTTAMFQLSRQFSTPVFVTSTTHLAKSQAELADRHIVITNQFIRQQLLDTCQAGVNLFTGDLNDLGKWVGLKKELVTSLGEYTHKHNFPLLIEADGSRQLPLKAPAENEPVIPGFSTHVVVLAGLSGLARPLNDESVHRSELFSRITNRKMNELVTLDDLETELLHPQGGLKNIPADARKTVILNQVSSFAEEINYGKTIQRLLSGFNSVVLANLNEKEILHSWEKVSGIILAAGGAGRFGSPKQLATWNDKTLIRLVTENALASNISEVIVVVGASEGEVKNQISDLPVKIVSNQNWKIGQSSSIITGLSAVSPNSGAAFFLLADQPLIEPELLNKLIQAHSQTMAPVIAPEFESRRGNPVLFDKVTFPDLCGLTGDIGGRAIFDKYPPLTIPWTDESIFMDIDTPRDLFHLEK